MVNIFGGIPKILVLSKCSQNIDGVGQKDSQGL